MQTTKSVIITCAGIGSRLGLSKPKCLLDIHGKPLIVRHLEMLRDVGNVYVVLGFQAKSVIEAILSIRRQVTFFFNHEFHNSGNLQSLRAASQYLTSRIVSLDGDLVIHPEDFMKVYNLNEDIIACYPPKTTDAVFCETRSINNNAEYVTNFSSTPTPLEWSGLFQVDSSKVTDNGYYIYEMLKQHLPMKLLKVRAMDIDTPNDHEVALKYSRNFYSN